MPLPKKALLLVASTGFLSACVTSSPDLSFDTTYTEQIEQGVTTKDDIRSHVGEPNSITMTPAGEIWRYVDLEGGHLIDAHKVMFGQPQKIRSTTLQVTFKGGVVADYALTTTKVDATCR